MNEYRFEDIRIGQTERFQREITAEMETRFREITGDINPLHIDDEFAKTIGEGRFSGHVCFGMLTASLYSTLAGVYLPGKYCLIHSIDKLNFNCPVYVGDVLTVTGTAKGKTEGLNLLQLEVTIHNQRGELVSSARMKIIVQK